MFGRKGEVIRVQEQTILGLKFDMASLERELRVLRARVLWLERREVVGDLALAVEALGSRADDLVGL